MALKQIFKRGADVVGNLFKDNDARLIKTTSKITGSAAPAVTGGKAVAKEAVSNFAKGVGSTAKIGGKVFAATGIVGVPIVAGTKIYDYLGDVRAKTEELRQYDQMIKLADKETDVVNKARDAELEYQKKLKDAMNGASGSLAASGGSDGTGGYFPILGNLTDQSANAADKAASNASSTKTIIYAVLALAAVGTGLYIYNKKSGGKK